MKVIQKFVKESNSAGNRLEARILEEENRFIIQHIINDSVKTEVIYDKNESIQTLENNAKDWLKEVQDLRG